MSNRSKRTKQFAALGGGALIAAPLLAVGQAEAAAFEVTNLNDSGAGSLRQAIDDANNASGADTITFAAGLTGTISLESQLAVYGAVDIVGPGASVLSVSGEDTVRPFYVTVGSGDDVTISGLTVTDGFSGGTGGAIFATAVAAGSLLTLDGVVLSNNVASSYGGAIELEQRLDLLVKNSTITGNTSTYGGAIYAEDDTYGNVTIEDSLISNNDGGNGAGGLYFDSAASLVITRSTFQNNTAEGGGAAEIGAAASVTITDSTFVGNTTTGETSGGALYFEAGSVRGAVTISGSTISGNSSSLVGGGIYFGGEYYGPVNIVNTTISGNTALYGGGIYVVGLYDTVTFNISHSTITGNSSTATDPTYNGGGGIYLGNDNFSSPGDINLNHTVVSGNTSTLPGTDISVLYGNIVGSWSMVGDLDGFTLSGANNLPEGDAKLGALADNGGPTKTHLPLAGSPLLNSGDPAFAGQPATDQRGEARVGFGRIDVGAVELNSDPEIPSTGSSSGLLTGLGAALLALGGAMHLGGRRRTQQS